MLKLNNFYCLRNIDDLGFMAKAPGLPHLALYSLQSTTNDKISCSEYKYTPCPRSKQSIVNPTGTPF